MPRIARVVVPGVPHHVTQRGNRRQTTFFSEADYRYYIAQMAESCRRNGVEVWAYGLMPNHVHLIAVPQKEDSLRAAVAEAHRRYTRRVNFRENWRGHLWQERFASFPMDERHLLVAARYVERNPVRAGLAARPEEYPWSSAAAHMSGKDDSLATVAPLLEMVVDWGEYLLPLDGEEELRSLRRHERTGRPLGSEAFIKRVEGVTGRSLHPQKRGPKGGD